MGQEATIPDPSALIRIAFLSVAFGGACGLNPPPAEQRAGTVPHAYQTTAAATGLTYARSGRVNCALDGEIDGFRIHVGKEHRNREQGMGYQTNATIDLGLSGGFALDTGSDGAGDVLRGARVELGDPVFDAEVQVWGDATRAQEVLTPKARAAILRARQHTRILIVRGKLIGEEPGHVDDASVLQQMIQNTVDVAKALQAAP